MRQEFIVSSWSTFRGGALAILAFALGVAADGCTTSKEFSGACQAGEACEGDNECSGEVVCLANGEKACLCDGLNAGGSAGEGSDVYPPR